MPRKPSTRYAKSVYGRHANNWIRKNDDFIYLLAVEETQRSLATVLSDRKSPKSISEARMFKTVISDLIATVQASTLAENVKSIVTHLLDPMIKPSSLEPTPTSFEGALEAVDAPLPRDETLPLEAEPAGFDDKHLFNEVCEVVEPLAESLVPPVVASFAKKAFKLGKASTKQVRPGTSTGNGPAQAKKPRKQNMRAMSPSLQFVRPHRTNNISAHDLQELKMLQHFDPASSDNMDEEGVSRRINIWGLHSHDCRLCSWISRYAWPLQDASVPLTGEQVRQILTLHVWASKEGSISYENLWEALQEEAFASSDGKINIESFYSYSS